MAADVFGLQKYNMEKVSVIIPTWNSASTLIATIKSCLNQTTPPFEILVCDDGSTDNSEGAVRVIGDSRVIWAPGEHSGTPAIPRNRGIAMAKGEWIAFCDSDDEWLPTKLEKQLVLANNLDYKASCTVALVKIDGIITKEVVSSWKKNTFTFCNALHSNDIVGSSVLMHSSIVKEIGEFTPIIENASFADYMYWLRAMTKTNFAYVCEPLVIYDDHPKTSLRATSLSDEALQKVVFADFTDWARNHLGNQAPAFILKIGKYKARESVRKIVSKIWHVWKK
ncbi:MAG: hypothetical protein RL641_106 [Candidatus Parcubacteria bacterium]|jgi:glycosyltransferase involved in cell wall biosynthesis